MRDDEERHPFATVNEIDSQSVEFIIIHLKFISVICTPTDTTRRLVLIANINFVPHPQPTAPPL